jgi:HlyD family type I secretion membrane fusion protein
MSLENSKTPAKGADKFAIGSRVAVAVVLGLALIGGCGGWAVHAQLTGAVMAQGKVAVRKQVKLIQHRDGGIVSEIRVTNGDAVNAGDVLVMLDETQTKAELGVLKGQRAELEGRRARHLAERDGAAAIKFDSQFESDSLTAEIARGEIRLFNENRAVREARREQLSLQIAQFEDQVRGLLAQQEANGSERKMIHDDIERLTPLYNKGFIEIGKIRTMERDLIKVDGLKGEIDANIARVKGQISESRIKIIEFDQQARSDGQRDLRDVDGKLSELQDRIVASLDRLSRMVIRSPIAGTVNELAVNSVNGVISPKETLMSIVPENADLVVEAKLSPTDIDQAIAGQSARLRFSAFNQRTTPEVLGTVETIGAAATLEQATGQTYYLSTIAIAGGQRQVAGKPIVPGMPVEVFLTTGDRSALSYLIKPFTDQMMKSFREE